MTVDSTGRSEVVPRVLLLVLRVYLGVIFLVAAAYKFLAEPSFASSFPGILTHGALQHGHPFYHNFIRSVVLPHASTFAVLVMYGELLTGLSLVAGAATRLGASGAMFLALNYMFPKGAWFWWPSSNDAAVLFIALTLLLGSAGRAVGVDQYLARRWPTVPAW
jgi:uncharacterized membrane protein YphA (DoxX/SURF4 family)